MNLQLEGQVVLVTGASSGIGLAAATQFAREGARVFLCARGEARLRDAARSLAEASGSPVGFHACDVTVPEAIDELHVRGHSGLRILTRTRSRNVARSSRVRQRASSNVICLMRCRGARIMRD